MGAYGPTPIVTPEIEEHIGRTVIEPVLRGMVKLGIPFTGALFAGLMIGADGAMTVLEYNVRFGDPETEVLMDLLDGDLGEALAGAAALRLDEKVLSRSSRHGVAVVLAAEGYPGKPRTGDAIEGLAEAARVPGVNVLHAGTRRQGDEIVTAGGRVLVVTATGSNLAAARDAAYEGVRHLHFRGMQVRRDIAVRALDPLVTAS
jgi:phosphoribosylamine--glycine ligase